MKEILATESIQLTRVHAIQWYGFCDSFDLGGQTVITGIYGCGKTGLVDLIQTVLLGHPEHETRYNLSLADIGGSSREEKRTLRGYCLQDLNIKNGGQPIFARHSSRTYIALEFTWPDHNRRETWGLRIEYSSIGSDADISYWKIPGRLNYQDFLRNDDIPLSAEEWEGLLNKYKERIFPSKDEYLDTLCAPQHLNFNLRVFTPLLLQTLQFKFGKDFTEFCRTNILPDAPINLETVRESYDRYRSLVAKMRLLKEQEQILQQIQESFAQQKKTRDEITAFEWFRRKQSVLEAKATWDAAETKWANLRSAAESWSQREADLKKQMEDAESHLADGHALMRRTPILDRYTLIDGNTFKHDSGYLLKSGQFQVILSDVEYYSFYGLTPDDFAPVSGKPLMDETLYNAYHNLGVIPNWVSSSFDITIGFESFVVVAVKGKGDPNPTITIFTQPESDRELVGDSAFLEVDAEPWDYLTYQWYFKKKPIPGATESWLLLSNLTAAQGGLYSVALSTGGKPVMSKSALLTIVQPVYVKKQPKSVVVKAGKKATFTVSAGGTPPYTYQ